MAVVVAASSFQNADGTSPFTVTKASVSAVTGDRLIVIISEHNDTNPGIGDLTVPSGWTSIATGVTTNATGGPGSQYARALYRDVQASDPASWDFGYAATADACCVVLRITGYDTSAAPIASGSGITAPTSSVISPSVTTTSADNLVLSAIASIPIDSGDVGQAWAATVPAGMANVGSTQVSSLYEALQVAQQTVVAVGATGTRTWTNVVTPAPYATTITIAVKPSAATALTIAASSFQNGDSTPPFTVTKASVGAVTGDRLIVITSEHNGSNPSINDLTIPSGWTIVTDATTIFTETATPGWQYMRVVYRDVQATDPASWTFGYASGADACCVVLRITGHNAAVAPVGVSAGLDYPTDTFDSPSVTPSSTSDLLICAISAPSANTSEIGQAWTSTIPSGMANIGSTQVASLYEALQVAREALSSGSATGVRTWTALPANMQFVTAASIAVTPAAGSAFTRTLTDLTALTDAASAAQTVAKSVTDSATLTDAVTPVLSSGAQDYTASIEDPLGTTDYGQPYWIDTGDFETDSLGGTDPAPTVTAPTQTPQNYQVSVGPDSMAVSTDSVVPALNGTITGSNYQRSVADLLRIIDPGQLAPAPKRPRTPTTRKVWVLPAALAYGRGSKVLDSLYKSLGLENNADGLTILTLGETIYAVEGGLGLPAGTTGGVVIDRYLGYYPGSY